MNAKIAVPILSALTLAVGLGAAPRAEAHPASPRARVVRSGPPHAPPHRIRALEAQLRAARRRARLAEREARLERQDRIRAEREADRMRLALQHRARTPRRRVGAARLRRLEAENAALRARLDRAEAQVDRLRRRARATGPGLARADARRGGRR